MFEIVPHTADVRIRVESPSLESLFEDAARALTEISEVQLLPDSGATRELFVESADSDSLLVDFLNEILSLLHIDRFAFTGIESLTIEKTDLRARLRLSAVENWEEDVKAVTYHEARVRHDGELWRTTIVLDI